MAHAKDRVIAFYDQEAETYARMYDEQFTGYPANAIRLKIITQRLQALRIQSVLDVGCGSCVPLMHLNRLGIQTRGFDFSPDMLRAGRANLRAAGLSEDLITEGDLETGRIPQGPFGAAMALGVFAHNELDDAAALRTLRQVLAPGGKVFIEFRNVLFSLTTFNQYSYDWLSGALLPCADYSPPLRERVDHLLTERCAATAASSTPSGKISYQSILAKFHNPLTLARDLLLPEGFALDALHFYHYHAAPPQFQAEFPEEFKRLSLALESPDDWRGYFLASAFVAEATRLD